MLLSRCLRGRPLFCGKQIINNVLRGCSTNVQETVPQNNVNKNNLSKSRIFPGYEVVYAFPTIRYFVLFNLGKTVTTALAGIGSVGSFLLCNTNVISHDVMVHSASLFVLGALWFHIGGFLITNFVGAIYVEENGEKTIISYVNYWGKRVNLTLDSVIITPLDELSPNIMKSMYRKLYTIEGEGKGRFLKIHLGESSTILNGDRLRTIIGTWE